MSWNQEAGAGTVASGWDNTGGGASSWNDNTVHADNNGDNFGDASGSNLNNGYGGDAGGEGGARDGACRRCGQEGHFANECDQPRQMGACFNCGEEGHSKADCTAPRKMGACFNCNEEGHTKAECTKPRKASGPCRASECPKRICKNCRAEGHDALECKENRVINLQHIADKTEAEAWKAVKQASDELDIAEFKEAVQVLVKACPELTYPKLEKEFRKRNMDIYLIALEKDHGDTLTSVNLQGQLGKKYVVGYYMSDKPQRPSLRVRWPKSPEENLKRLEDAGVPMDRCVTKCSNCNELGHIARGCPQEKQEIERARVNCALCGADGHRARDCNDRPPPRPGRGCRVCQSEEHQAKDCPNREKRTCRNCGSEDHMAKECDQPRNPATIQCRNCLEFGHTGKECTAPKDWSKVKCNECGEMGHTVARCKQRRQKEEGGGGFENDDTTGGMSGNAGGGGGGWDQPGAAGGSGQPEWESSNNNNENPAFGGHAPVAVGGSGW